MHQAEKYIKQIVEEIGRPSYMQEFLKQGKDKKAVEDVAGKLKQFSENMSVLQPVSIKGSLMLFRYLQEELEVMEKMLQDDFAEKETGRKAETETNLKTGAAHLKEEKADRKAKANTHPKGRPVRQAKPDSMTAEQKEEMRTRLGIVRRRLLDMTESLLPQHIADQIEQRTDEKAAQEAFQQNGYLPLYVDEKTMGIVYNTLTVQLLLDRFNLLFEGVFAPLDQETVNSVMANVLAPFWKQNAQSILFTMEE